MRNTVLNYYSKKLVYECIWGESPENIFALGAYLDNNNLFNNTVMAHYDGAAWKFIDNIKIRGICSKLVKSKKYYFLNAMHWDSNYGDSSYIYRFDGKEIKTIYGGTWGRDQFGTFAQIGNEVLFVLGQKICTYSGINFNTILNVDNPDFENAIAGRNRKDIILFMKNGLAHYNGSDVKYIYYFPSDICISSGLVIFKNEIHFDLKNHTTGIKMFIKGELK